MLKIIEHDELPYKEAWERMKTFTDNRDASTQDQIWFLQHPAVYTQGTSCIDQPKSSSSSIPVVHSDRGGQMTYHGPGQLIIYFLMDIKRLQTGPKSFVNRLERLTIDNLAKFGISAKRRTRAPGVYVSEKKIAALGLRIRKGCCYHGISLNVDMDLTPFTDITPCGIEDLEVTQMIDWNTNITMDDVIDEFKTNLEIEFC